MEQEGMLAIKFINYSIIPSLVLLSGWEMPLLVNFGA